MISKKNLISNITEQFRLVSTSAVLRSSLIAKKLGINPTDLESIEILMRTDKMTAGLLAAETGLTTGAVTGIIDRLVRAGFADREYDPDDRRKVYIVLNMPEIEKRVFPLYQSLSANTEKFLMEYSEEQLEFVLNFMKKTNEISNRDMEELGKACSDS
ncbi:MAG: MarR family transcriptional regulator [Spirochaetes bacterium]|nr:MarR family transcriptional regulator [Spirochaetota bacterium]